VTEPGFAIVTREPSGEVSVGLKYLRVAHDGAVHLYDGLELERLRREDREEAAQWDPTLSIPAYQAPIDRTRADEELAHRRHFEPNPDLVPLLCQYTGGNICLDADIGFGYHFRARDLSLPLGGQIVFSRTLFAPHSSHILNSFLGEPNDLRIGLDYDPLNQRFRGRLGTDIGIPQVYFISDFGGGREPLLGLEVRGMPALPITPLPKGLFAPFPGLFAWLGWDLNGRAEGGVGLRFDVALLAGRPGGHKHEQR
jgi:hypothetical protein